MEYFLIKKEFSKLGVQTFLFDYKWLHNSNGKVEFAPAPITEEYWLFVGWPRNRKLVRSVRVAKNEVLIRFPHF